MSVIKQLKQYSSFTEEDLNLSKEFLATHKLSYPHFYESGLYNKSFKFIKRALISADAISFNTRTGNMQDPRESGLNPKINDIQVDLEEFGYRLYCVPIAIRKTSDGKYVILNGRTRDKILRDLGIKNRIVDIYECDDAAALQFAVSANSEQPPAGLAMSADIVYAGKKSIQNGWLENEYDAIYDWVCNACGTRFVEGKRREMVNQIHNHAVADEKGHEIVAWSNSSEPEAWMTEHNYVDTSGKKPVKYIVASYSVCSKTIFRACAAAMENPGTEIRVVIHTGNLTASDIVRCYIKRVLGFKKEWNLKLSQVSLGLFGGASPLNNRIKVYGCIPALSEISDLDELIIFGKNDQKISDSYLTTRGVSTLFDIEDDYEEEEEGDEELID